MSHRRYPSYPDDADYTTNSPSYYDDLARKQGLIKELAERIWGYEETLNLSLADIAKRFIEWDIKIGEIDLNVNELLQEWISDGTFDHIINDTIFGWKANQSDLDTTNQKLKAIDDPNLVFTFDDGFSEDSLTAAILKEFGFVGSFGVITENIYNAGKNSLNNYAKYEQEDGSEVLSHSSTHISLGTAKDEATKVFELKHSADKLRRMGFSANGFIAPYSVIHATNRETALKTYDYLLIGGSGLNGKNDFKTKVLTRVSQYASGVATSKALVDQAISENKLLVFYDHRIGTEGSMSEADFRELLTYVKTKSDSGLIKVQNMKNAINTYYGISLPNRAKGFNGVNLSPNMFDSDSWGFGVNTSNAADMGTNTTKFGVASKRLDIPLGTSVGTSFNYVTTITLPSKFDDLGEVVKFAIDLSLSNSQYSFFTTSLEVSFLTSADVLLLRKTKVVNPATQLINAEFNVMNENPVDVKQIAKVKVGVNVEVLTSPTVFQTVYLTRPVIQFPNLPSNKLTADENLFVKFTETNATPNVSNYKNIYIVNTVPTTITNFVTYKDTSEFTVLFGDNVTTVDGSVTGLIRTFNGLPVTPKSGSIMTFVKIGGYSTAWFEKSRTIRTV